MAAVALSEMTMEEKFDTCSEFVSKTMSVQTDWPKSTPAEKLEIYKWFKHIKDGDAPKDRPSFTSALMKTGGPIAAAELQARFDVWAACRGASKDTAMAAYVWVFCLH